jgi:hypothetical protein
MGRIAEGHLDMVLETLIVGVHEPRDQGTVVADTK